MAKKKDVLGKILIAGALVAGGILVYKMISKPTPASAPGPVYPPTTTPTTGSGSILSAVPSIVNLVKGIFSSSSSSSTSGGGSSNYVPSGSEFGFMAGRTHHRRVPLR